MDSAFNTHDQRGKSYSQKRREEEKKQKESEEKEYRASILRATEKQAEEAKIQTRLIQEQTRQQEKRAQEESEHRAAAQALAEQNAADAKAHLQWQKDIIWLEKIPNSSRADYLLAKDRLYLLDLLSQEIANSLDPNYAGNLITQISEAETNLLNHKRNTAEIRSRKLLVGLLQYRVENSKKVLQQARRDNNLVRRLLISFAAAWTIMGTIMTGSLEGAFIFGTVITIPLYPFYRKAKKTQKDLNLKDSSISDQLAKLTEAKGQLDEVRSNHQARTSNLENAVKKIRSDIETRYREGAKLSWEKIQDSPMLHTLVRCAIMKAEKQFPSSCHVDLEKLSAEFYKSTLEIYCNAAVIKSSEDAYQKCLLNSQIPIPPEVEYNVDMEKPIKDLIGEAPALVESELKRRDGLAGFFSQEPDFSLAREPLHVAAALGSQKAVKLLEELSNIARCDSSKLRSKLIRQFSEKCAN